MKPGYSNIFIGVLVGLLWRIEGQFQPSQQQQQQQPQPWGIDPQSNQQQQQQGGQPFDPRFQQQPQQQFPGSQQQQFPNQQQFGSASGPLQNQQQQQFGPSSNQDQFGNFQNQNQQPQQQQQFGGQQQTPNQWQQQPGGQFGSQNQFQPGSGMNLPAPPTVRITTDLLPADRATHTDNVHWSAPKSDVIYCVSTAPVTSLHFYCPDCNGTNSQLFNGYLSKATPYEHVAGFPALRLSSVDINGEEHMKRLACAAVYGTAPNGQSLNVTVGTVMLVQYLTPPVILDSQGHGPLYLGSSDGFQFYVPDSGNFLMYCLATGNPAPSQYNWTVNGAPIPNANSQTLRVDAPTYAGKALNCRAISTAYPRGMESPAVGIMRWIPAQMVSHNFQELQKQSGLFEQSTSNVPLGRTAQLQCGGVGLPAPWIWWRQELSPNHVINATCDGGRQDSTPTVSQTGYSVTSQCSININSYYKSGKYWCSACNYLSAGTYQCSPDEKQSSMGVKVDVVGQPLVSQEEPPRIEKDELNMNSVKAAVTYCGNPEPVLPDGVYWQINGQRLNIQKDMDNYFAEAPEQNTTIPNCWVARLRIRDVTEADKTKTYRLTVTNQMGTTEKEFQLNQLNSTQPAIEETRVATIVGIIVPCLIVVLALLACVFCWWKRLLCFKEPARKPPTSQPKLSKKDKYQSNVVPDTIRSERLPEKTAPPISRPPYDVPPSEKEPSPVGRRTHEGLNYAELDLVKDSHRPPPTQYRPPMDYTQFQPRPIAPIQLKSPTNSVV